MPDKPKPRVRILLGAVIAIGPGKADLLHAIQATGSISAAARQMNMSYKRAWDLVGVMNKSFLQPLVDTSTGGKGGGGTRLTDFGKDILRRYRRMESKAAACIEQDITEMAELMAPADPPAS